MKLKPAKTFKQYWYDLFLMIVDVLVNAIAAGGEVTISSRAHVLATQLDSKYWIAVEKIIDWSFVPIQGWGHCKDAYESDKLDYFYMPTWWTYVLTTVVFVPVAVIVIRPSCEAIKRFKEFKKWKR